MVACVRVLDYLERMGVEGLREDRGWWDIELKRTVNETLSTPSFKDLLLPPAPPSATPSAATGMEINVVPIQISFAVPDLNEPSNQVELGLETHAVTNSPIIQYSRSEADPK